MKQRILKVRAGVRYFEDTDVCYNNQDWHGDDPDNPSIPCVEVDENGEHIWCPEIDPNTGKILNWKEGWEADTHYKVCDECEIDYYEEGKKICDNDGEYYVPNFLCPGGEGYGDYMIMKIDQSGMIQDWDIKQFNGWVKRHATVYIPGLIDKNELT